MDKIQSIAHLISLVKSFRIFPDSFIIFRGQSHDLPLNPSICRKNPTGNISHIEKKMLKEFKNRSNLLITEVLNDDWDWLTYAQHFGMFTRLLDWTTNPLIALWFAIKNERYFDNASFLYLFFVDDEDFISEEERERGPFSISKSKVLLPILNNKRLVAQQSWFTAHSFSTKANRFVPLGENSTLKKRLLTFEIPSKLKADLLNELNILGINYQSLYPDIIGVCEYINWQNSVR